MVASTCWSWKRERLCSITQGLLKFSDPDTHAADTFELQTLGLEDKYLSVILTPIICRAGTP